MKHNKAVLDSASRLGPAYAGPKPWRYTLGGPKFEL